MDLPKYGAGIGLHRMDYLCADLLNTEWWRALDPVNIVGTNGKGSTTAMIAAILNRMDIPTGQYTSPHLFDFSERIQYQGRAIEKADLIPYIRSFFFRQKNYLRQYPGDLFGAFEAFTSIALHYFFQKNTEALVLEAGIGGRYDPTRICTGRLAGLTSLDLEHTQLLGSTLEQIAMDKMDIARPGATVVLGEIDAEVHRKLKSYAKIKGVELLSISEECRLGPVNFKGEKMVVDFHVQEVDFGRVSCNLLGYHQVNNMLLAVLLVKKWLERNRPGISKAQLAHAVQSALPSIQWKGRFEKIRQAPDVYIDVGHTPAALRHLARTAEQSIKKPVLLVFGVSHDKDPQSLYNELAGIASETIVTRAYHRGKKLSEVILSRTMQKKEKDIIIDHIEPMEKAIDLAVKRAAEQNMTILIAGSLFLTIEAQAYLNDISPKSLRFF